MKINIKSADVDRLAQFIYLGNLIINGYKKTKEVEKEYSALAEDVYLQIVSELPAKKLNYKLKHIPNEKSAEAKVSDYRDKIADSVQDFYQDFENSLLCEYINDLHH